MKLLVLASLALAFISLVVYVTSIIAVHGIRKSISDSNYFLQKPFKLMFELVMWISGLSIIITGAFIKTTPDWIIILGGIGIFMVGIFSDFKKHILVKIGHFTFAIGGFTTLALSLYFSFNNLSFTIIIALFSLIAGLFANKKIWALELALAIGIFSGLFFYAHSLM